MLLVLNLNKNSEYNIMFCCRPQGNIAHFIKKSTKLLNALPTDQTLGDFNEDLSKLNPKKKSWTAKNMNIAVIIYYFFFQSCSSITDHLFQ